MSEHIDKDKERELAEYFERRKGQVSTWRRDDSLALKGGTPALSAFHIFFTTEELKDVQRAADAEGITITEFIKRSTLRVSKDNDGVAEDQKKKVG